jgi:hypothetical protein
MSAVTDPTPTELRPAPRALAARPSQTVATASPAGPRGLAHVVRGAVVPYLSRQVQSLGRAGLAGVMMLVFAAAFFVGAISPLQGELADLQTTLDTAQLSHAGTHANATSAHTAELDNFMAQLPLRSELPALTLQITTQATKAGLELERGTYDVTVTPSGRLARARLSFPVHGRYPDVRRFIDGTLAAIPGAAVDALRFERKSVTDAEIDADVRFALYFRTAP